MTKTGWSTTRSDEVYSNRWIRVLHDEVVMPDGGTGVYGVVEVRSPAVFVVAMDDEDRVLLVEVDRYTTGSGWEIPSGGSDGEDALMAGKRELLEETGAEARSWRVIGSVESLNGVCRAPGSVVLAEGVRVKDLVGAGAAAEGITATRWVEWSELADLIASGAIRDGETLAALTSAAVALGRWG